MSAREIIALEALELASCALALLVWVLHTSAENKAGISVQFRFVFESRLADMLTV